MRIVKWLLLWGLVMGTVWSQVGVGYYLDAYSHYMWRGYDLSGDAPLLAPGATFELGESGLWLDTWLGVNADYLEVDLTAAYSLEPNDALGIDFGVIMYTYPGDDAADMSYEPFIQLFAYETAYSPELLVAYDVVLESLYLEGAGSQEILADTFPLTTSIGLGVYSWQDYAGISNLRLGVSKDFEFGPVVVSPALELHLLPQGWRDENLDPGLSSNEIVFSLSIEPGSD